MDSLSSKHRSWNMSRIKNRDTKPELIVRSLLHRKGYRFRLHKKDLPGKPDIILSRFKKIIFVHGCFWHRHEGCCYAYNPKSRISFWQNKFNQNIERDKFVQKELFQMGWQVHVIWECEIKIIELLEKKIEQIFSE
ncbi:MAG: DNA mismatch endonuclease Vsr [Proteobacteria bacterium]|nr:DNA mismatch endonuclease Vsr [Desulfobacula sp.]MBU4133349.1 DNA mismatch endonuclease Vsr [Pseudomonadota bacterium]